MPTTTILGVDFSGAKSDSNSWVATGELTKHKIKVLSYRRITRLDLTELIKRLPFPTTAAMDFPFSLPKTFAKCVTPQAISMPDIWQAIHKTEFDDFISARDKFVSEHGEIKRWGDSFFPESYSCLHKANPNMLPMTFRGMQMLHELWKQNPHIPPLAQTSATTGLTLLEVMPGAALKALGLPYKGYKNGVHAVQLRKTILTGLQEQLELDTSSVNNLLIDCVTNHDCLDALVAMIVAALWNTNCSAFLKPPKPPRPNSKLPQIEGWLFAPIYYVSNSSRKLPT